MSRATKPPSPITSNSRKWQRLDATQRRELIVETALKLLHREGLAAVTMRRVAAKLGVGAMTLYTYIDGQSGLHRAMVQRAFEMLNSGCKEHSTYDLDGSWRGGAMHYVRFAIDNPNLFRLMFDTALPESETEHLNELLHGGFQPLLDRVKERLAAKGVHGQLLDREARASAGRYWIALHGLAMLAISGRLVVLEGSLEELLDDLLSRVAPE